MRQISARKTAVESVSTQLIGLRLRCLWRYISNSREQGPPPIQSQSHDSRISSLSLYVRDCAFACECAYVMIHCAFDISTVPRANAAPNKVWRVCGRQSALSAFVGGSVLCSFCCSCVPCVIACIRDYIYKYKYNIKTLIYTL